jgi:hypothetical protein
VEASCGDTGADPSKVSPASTPRSMCFRTKTMCGQSEVNMTAKLRIAVLRANAVYLVAAAAGGLWWDILGVFFARGHLGSVLSGAPHTAIGFVEAHGLALIIGVLLWLAPPERKWHIAAAAVHLLLGTANLVFWQIFVAADLLAVGYITTSLHLLFAALQMVSAAASTAIAQRPSICTRT